MNRTYFGDTRDLFKFDLVRHIMKAVPAFESFTFVPMLTGIPGGMDMKKGIKKDLLKAKKAGKAGSQNQDLVTQMEYLQGIRDDLDYFQHIRDYFRRENILSHIFSEQEFSHQERSRYFEQILSHLPKKALIVLDPDTGLEENRPTEKNLLLSEVKRITDRMDSRSALLIYQHFPRTKDRRHIHNRCCQLNELTGTDLLAITDNENLFFLLVKNQKLMSDMEEVLERYANSYPSLTSYASAA
jgi:hypothetical protein